MSIARESLRMDGKTKDAGVESSDRVHQVNGGFETTEIGRIAKNSHGGSEGFGPCPPTKMEKHHEWSELVRLNEETGPTASGATGPMWLAFDMIADTISRHRPDVGELFRDMATVARVKTAEVALHRVERLASDLVVAGALQEVDEQPFCDAVIGALREDLGNAEGAGQRMASGLQKLQRQGALPSADGADLEIDFTDLASHAFACALAGGENDDPVNAGIEVPYCEHEPVGDGEPVAFDNRIFVKTGNLERHSKLRVSNLVQEPFYTEKTVKSPFFDREYRGIGLPYLTPARISVQAKLVPNDTSLSGKYMVDLDEDLVTEDVEQVVSGTDGSIYSSQLFESGGALDDAIDRAQQALMENRQDLSDDAKMAASEFAEAKMKGTGKMAGKLAGALADTVADFFTSILSSAGGVGEGFMRTSNIHVTMMGSSGVPRSIVLGVQSDGTGEDVKASAARLLRPSREGSALPVTTAVRTDANAFLRTWVGASAPSRPIGRKINEFFLGLPEPLPLETAGRAPAPQAVAYRVPLSVPAETAAAFKKRGVVPFPFSGLTFVDPGFGIIFRVTKGQGITYVAQRSDVRLIPDDDPRLPDIVGEPI